MTQLKPFAAYEVWTTHIKERMERALKEADWKQPRHWVTGALSTTCTPWDEEITVGRNVNYPTTNGHETFRIVAMTLDDKENIVFVAHSSEAVTNQCPTITAAMFSDDHRHIEAWY